MKKSLIAISPLARRFTSTFKAGSNSFCSLIAESKQNTSVSRAFSSSQRRLTSTDTLADCLVTEIQAISNEAEDDGEIDEDFLDMKKKIEKNFKIKDSPGTGKY